MPSYKLTYFNVRFRPEITRLMFGLSGVEYEDVRLEEKEFGVLKASGKLPLGQVPILEVDGRLLVQSRAIQRYIAREFNLYGSGNLEAEEIDEAVETADELLDFAAPFLYREPDLTKRAEIKKEYGEKKGPLLLKFLEKKLEKKQSGFFVGASITVADLAVFNILDILNDHIPELLSSFPKLLELKAKVESNEQIAKYLAARPKTSM